jgi:hypothetical protein
MRTGDHRFPGLDFSTKQVTLLGSNCYARSGAHTVFAIARRLIEKTWGTDFTKHPSFRAGQVAQSLCHRRGQPRLDQVHMTPS